MSETNTIKKPSFGYALGTFAYVTPVVLVIVTLFGSDTKYVTQEHTGKGE